MYRFVFEIRFRAEQTEEEYIKVWKKGSTRIQTFPGACGTILHRKAGEPGILLAIATWASKEARDHAMNELSKTADAHEILHRHTECGEITVLGSFEEIDRVEPRKD